MAPAKRKIHKKKNPQAHRSLSNYENESLQRIVRASALLGVDVPLLVFLPPKSGTDLTADRHRGQNPACPQQNQEHRRISFKEELAKLDMVIEKVSARLLFLQSVAKRNAENSSNQEGDVTTSAPTVVGDAAPANQG